MESINILYIDDNADPYISQYLCEEYKHEQAMISYKEHAFEIDESYDTLLSESALHAADVIIIDSVLFEHANMSSEKLTGEEFKIILQKVFPFKEVVVVTQNDIDEDVKILKKYDTSSEEEATQFFEREWNPTLNQAIDKIKACRKILKRIEEKNYVEKYFFETIQQSLQGENGYNSLTVADIDRLISAFEGVKKEYD